MAALGLFFDGAIAATGWAVMEFTPDVDPPLIARGTFQAPPGSSRSWGWRWHLICEFAQDKIDEYKPLKGAFEAPYIGDITPKERRFVNPEAMVSSEAAIRSLIGTDAMIEMVFARNHIPATEVVSATAKKAMTGHGRPGKNRDENKRLMKAHAIARGYLVADDNQADAIAVGLVCIGNHFRGRTL